MIVYGFRREIRKLLSFVIPMLFRLVGMMGFAGRILVIAVCFFSPIPLVFRNFLGWHGIIAADRKGLTAKDAPHGKSESHKKATFGKRLNGVGGAGRGEPT